MGGRSRSGSSRSRRTVSRCSRDRSIQRSIGWSNRDGSRPNGRFRRPDAGRNTTRSRATERRSWDRSGRSGSGSPRGSRWCSTRREPIMRWPAELRLRLRSLFLRDTVERELEEEMRFHMEHESIGAPQAARVMEECRQARGTRWLENLAQDWRYGLRLMRKSPGFAAAAVLTIAIGIAAATAIFSVVYGVAMQP